MLTFVFEIQGNDNVLRLEQQFKKCRPQLFKAENGIIKISFDDETENLKNIWSAVWNVTYKQWFVNSITGWYLEIEEKGEVHTEDILKYCKENSKGLFRPD